MTIIIILILLFPKQAGKEYYDWKKKFDKGYRLQKAKAKKVN